MQKRDNLRYCKLRSFRENFIFANGVKIHSCDVNNSRLEHYIPTPVADGRVISPFREGFIFTKLRLREVSRKLNHREMF